MNMILNETTLVNIKGIDKQSELDNPLWPFQDPPSITPFWFETCEIKKKREFIENYWWVSIVLSIVYLALIYKGQQWMKNRQPFKLDKTLIVWNAGLAIFSIVCFSRTFPELMQILTWPNGFHRSVCYRENLNMSSCFWAWWFMISKIVELGDTAFIILRKRPLIFLHWFHHITVLITVWFTVLHFDPVGRWFGIVNLFVHSIMYSYYAVKAMKIRVPRIVSMSVTIVQLSQMVVAVGLNVYAIWMKVNGEPCARSEAGLKIHLSIYLSYLILFTNFFIKAYFPSQKTKKT